MFFHKWTSPNQLIIFHRQIPKHIPVIFCRNMSQNWLCMLHSISQTFQASGICIANFLSAILDRQSKRLVLNDSWAVCGREEICVRLSSPWNVGRDMSRQRAVVGKLRCVVLRFNGQLVRERKTESDDKAQSYCQIWSCVCGEVYVRARSWVGGLIAYLKKCDSELTLTWNPPHIISGSIWALSLLDKIQQLVG